MSNEIEIPLATNPFKSTPALWTARMMAEYCMVSPPYFMKAARKLGIQPDFKCCKMWLFRYERKQEIYNVIEECRKRCVADVQPLTVRTDPRGIIAEYNKSLGIGGDE